MLDQCEASAEKSKLYVFAAFLFSVWSLGAVLIKGSWEIKHLVLVSRAE
jgi:hypothetical protein